MLCISTAFLFSKQRKQTHFPFLSKMKTQNKHILCFCTIAVLALSRSAHFLPGIRFFLLKCPRSFEEEKNTIFAIFHSRGLRSSGIMMVFWYHGLANFVSVSVSERHLMSNSIIGSRKCLLHRDITFFQMTKSPYPLRHSNWPHLVLFMISSQPWCWWIF